MTPTQRVQQHFRVQQDWKGNTLPAPAAEFILEAQAGHLAVNFRAPRRGDRPPQHPVGRCPRLWEHEVVELFLLGERDAYLELEWGPAGHWLALRLEGRRCVVDDRITVSTTFWSDRTTWGGDLLLEAARLPPTLGSANAFAIFGPGTARAYRAHRGSPDAEGPDFHRLESFVPLRADLLEALGPTGADWG